MSQAEASLAAAEHALFETPDPLLKSDEMRLRDGLNQANRLRTAHADLLEGRLTAAYEAYKDLRQMWSDPALFCLRRLASSLHDDLTAHLETLAKDYWKAADEARTERAAR